MNPWKSTAHKETYEHTENEGGIILSFETDDTTIKETFDSFTKWITKTYDFPIRIHVLITEYKKIKLENGKRVLSQFKHFHTHDDCEIILTIKQYKKNKNLDDLLSQYIHELTHYMQWINTFDQMPKQSEKEANHYKKTILVQYHNEELRSSYGTYIHKMYADNSLHRILSYVFAFLCIGILFLLTLSLKYITVFGLMFLIMYTVFTLITLYLLEVIFYKVTIDHIGIFIRSSIKPKKIFNHQEIRESMKIVTRKKLRDEVTHHLIFETKNNDKVKIKNINKELIKKLKKYGYKIPGSHNVIN